MNVLIYSSFGQPLESIWRRLQDDCDHYVFQTYEWLAHWQSTVGQHSYGIEPVVAVLSDQQRPLALFPFGLRRVGTIRVLEFLGGGQCDYNTPIMVPELLMPGKFSMLWERVLEELPAHDVRYFLRVPQLLGNLRNPFLDVAHSFYDGPAYAAALSDSWDEFQSGLPAKFRKDNARMIRRLSEIGQLRFIVASTDAEFGNIVDAMFAQKERRYKETGAINILADINVRAFYRDSGTAICGDAKIHLSALILNDEILATHWGVFHRDRFYYLFPAFASEAWAKFSPGRLLLEHLVQWAIDNRVRIFDFTTGGESYKEIWCDSEMQLSRIVQPLTGVGHLFTWVQALIYWVKTNRRSRALAMRVLHVLSALNRH